jgi:addiction module HigA family antidote
MITVKGTDAKMTASNLTPFEPSHPGELLKDELQEREISQRHFAELVDVPYTALNEILNCKRPMSVDFCLRVEAALGIDADIFINMQTRYNTQIARKDKVLTKRLDLIRVQCASPA